MNAIRAIIADDEELARSRLARLIKKCSNDIDVVGEAGDGKATVELIERQKPELAFLDIQMPVLTGIEVALTVRHKPFVIFVTAFNQFALEAFKASAVDYLVKPVEEETLCAAIKKFKRLVRPVSSFETIVNQLADRIGIGGQQRLSIPTGDSIKLVPYDEIICLEADNKYTTVYTNKGNYISEISLTDFQNSLPQNRFVRIHRKHIVNFTYVDEIKKWFDRRLKIKLTIPFNKELIVGRGYVGRVRNV
jgi:two-component system, LytTR family, response regulator